MSAQGPPEAEGARLAGVLAGPGAGLRRASSQPQVELVLCQRLALARREGRDPDRALGGPQAC